MLRRFIFFSVRNNNVRNDGNVVPSSGVAATGTEQGAGGDVNLPDSTTKSPKTNKGKRNQRSQKNNNNNNNSTNNNNVLIKTETPVVDTPTATANTLNNATPAPLAASN